MDTVARRWGKEAKNLKQGALGGEVEMGDT